MENKEISDFGKMFIGHVRDNSLSILERIISGEMKSQNYKILHEKLKGLSEQEMNLIEEIGFKMVDLTIHNTMFLFEQEIDGWKISNPEKGIENLADISDGLAGELYGEEGWIEMYSEYDLYL